MWRIVVRCPEEILLGLAAGSGKKLALKILAKSSLYAPTFSFFLLSRSVFGFGREFLEGYFLLADSGPRSKYVWL